MERHTIRINYQLCVTFEKLTILLINAPQLRTFVLEACGKDFADGNKWQDLIEKHLSSLKNFRFEFCIYKSDNIDEIWSTFQSDFWLKIKKWFVKYDYRGNYIQPTRIYTVGQTTTQAYRRLSTEKLVIK